MMNYTLKLHHTYKQKMTELQIELDKTIRTIPDFPKPGIQFKDISTVLENPELSKKVIQEFVNQSRKLNLDAIVGVESRGFIFGMAIAVELGIPFVLVRKKGKLPYKTVSYSYDLEYGSAEIEMHVDSIKPDWNVMVHDDLLATGGTASAASELILKQNAKVAGFSFLVGLDFLNGKDTLAKYSKNIIELITF